MLLFLMTAAVFISDDVSFANLGERKIVQLVTTSGETLYRAIRRVENDKLTVVDVSTLKEEQFEKSQLKSVRTTASDRTIAEKVGLGQWVAWQLHPIFEGASKPQTIASIQQTAVYVTANPYSGLMIGDKVDVFRLGEPVKDPVTGEEIDIPEQKIAKLEVIDISDRLLTCRPTGEFVIELKVGDVVRPTEPRTSVAVLPFMNTAGAPVQSGVSMADETTNALVNLGIPTLERARTVEILGEQLRQLSLVYEGGDASRVGKLLGAATLVTGRLIGATDKRKVITLSIRLLDVRTGSILKSFEIELNSTKLDMTAVSIFPKGGVPDTADTPAIPTTTNSIGMTFVVIPAGEFMMGSPQFEAGREQGETQHRVTLTQSFGMGIFEVTQAQYEQVVGSNRSGFRGANNPVETVSWKGAVAFCGKLSSLPAERAAGRVYRLPTEAEWEYACRAGTTTVYSFGDDAKDLGKYAWFGDNSDKTTHGVGEKLPNGWGLYDMHGNVWEWCSDEMGSCRGGCLSDDATGCRTARFANVPSYRHYSTRGFRVALSLAGQ